MPDANPISGYNAPATTYHSTLNAAQFSRTIRVTSSTNNPLTLTGSYANNAGFIVFNTGSLLIRDTSGTIYSGGDFHSTNTTHTVYTIALSYVSASLGGGDIVVLYNS
jgi:hypothetical protein